MKNAYKIIALFLCIILTFSACSNTKNDDETTTQTEETTVNTENTNTSEKGDGKIALPYNETDGLNPYFAKSNENLYICSLLFDSLFSLDENYNANPEIAKSITVNGNKATVSLRTDASCKGSQPINAQDVVYSFNLAKASYAYSGCLNGIASAEVSSTHSVVFTLEYSDVYVSAKLTFPIVKHGTADIQASVPTGSGDYYYVEGTLINNTTNEQIGLYSIDTSKSAENAFKIGATDAFFSDLADCEYTGVAGDTQEVLLNNMVYLGFNSSNGGLNEYVRSAIAAKINGEDIVVSAYQGHGIAAKLPVNPNSYINKNLSTVSVQGDKTLAENILDRCGFIRYSGKAKTNGSYLLSFNLIVNRDNLYRLAAAYLIADSLNEIGFYITVHPLSFADYNERIASGNYHMYLGEVKLDGSMDLSQFFKENGSLSVGIDLTSKAATKYFEYRAGKITTEEYYEFFKEEYPFVPVIFRAGYMVTSTDIKDDLLLNPFI